MWVILRMEPALRREASDFLGTLLATKLPAGIGRLYLPILMTDDKLAMMKVDRGSQFPAGMEIFVMAAKCFQSALDRSQVTAETSDTAGSLMFLVCAIGAAVAADGSNDLLPNVYSELKRRIVLASGGKRSVMYRDLERLLTSLEMKANS